VEGQKKQVESAVLLPTKRNTNFSVFLKFFERATGESAENFASPGDFPIHYGYSPASESPDAVLFDAPSCDGSLLHEYDQGELVPTNDAESAVLAATDRNHTSGC
jgi:hypothetical protein